MASTPAVALKAVYKSYPRHPVLRDLDLVVRRGQALGLVGANGSGKSTVVRLLAGLLRPDRGDVAVLGHDLARPTACVRALARTSFVLEDDGLYPHLSALDNLELWAAIRGLSAADRAAGGERLLRDFGLWERRHEVPAAWSKGLRQRLAVARALLPGVDLMVLDEPFAALDRAAVRALQERLLAFVRGGGAVLMVSHELAHLEPVCDAVVALTGGTVHPIVAEGTEQDLVITRFGGRQFSAKAREAISALPVRIVVWEDHRAVVVCPRFELPRLMHTLLTEGVAVEEMAPLASGLERAYLEVLRRPGPAALGEAQE